jgi:transposase-like protein
MFKPEIELETERLVLLASFRWNEKRQDYNRVNVGNLRKFGATRKGRQRWQCATYTRVFAETRGTVFAELASRYPSDQKDQRRDSARLTDQSRRAHRPDRRGADA